MTLLTPDKLKFIVITVLLIIFLCYSIYLYSALPVKHTTEDKAADSGKIIWQKYNCNACHQVYGLGGYLGPDITNVYAIKGTAYIRAFLKNGTTIMPDFKLTEREITDLIAFLKNIDATGKSDPKSFSLTYDGTIEQ
jgi:nitric oxide reductase subunit C